MIDPKAEVLFNTPPRKPIDIRYGSRSWWCAPCSQEVHSVRCKYCGKAEDEEK